MTGQVTAWPPASRRRLVAVACWCLASIAVPAAAEGPGKYAARRFDVAVTVLDNGSLDVTETIQFEFQTGTFKKVWREIPAQRTDGIEIVQARMDGVTFPRGEEPGQIDVSGRNRIKVEWRFQPAGPSVHTFELRYIARGVAYREDDRDVVRWRLLPSEHQYRDRRRARHDHRERAADPVARARVPPGGCGVTNARKDRPSKSPPPTSRRTAG